MNQTSDTNQLLEIAIQSITKRVESQYAFYFRKPNTQIIVAVARNLTDLLIHVEKIDLNTLKFHLFRKSELHLDGSPNGNQDRSDIALWVQYILGDDLLASQIWDLKANIETSTIRDDLVKILRKRHNELIEFLKKDREK